MRLNSNQNVFTFLKVRKLTCQDLSRLQVKLMKVKDMLIRNHLVPDQNDFLKLKMLQLIYFFNRYCVSNTYLSVGYKNRKIWNPYECTLCVYT